MNKLFTLLVATLFAIATPSFAQVDCDDIISCILENGESFDFSPCDSTIVWDELDCSEILINGNPIDDYDYVDNDDDYDDSDDDGDYDDDDGYDNDDDWDWDDCDSAFVCISTNGYDTTFVNLCDTTINFEYLDCIWEEEDNDDSDDDEDYDDDDGDSDDDDGYDNDDDWDWDDCDSAFVCISVNSLDTTFVNLCDTTLDWTTLDCIWENDNSDNDDDGDDDEDYDDDDGDSDDDDGWGNNDDFDWPTDSLWNEWDCDTLITLVIADVDTLVIDPCDEDVWDDIEDYFDCIWDEYEDCPWDTAGFYVWGVDGREFVAFENASVVGFEEWQQDKFNISPVYPNPAINQINLTINAIKISDVKLKVYDVNGQEHYNSDYKITAGTNQLNIDLNNLVTGVYHLYIYADNEILSSQKLSIIK